jgi:hypothetical protein
MLFASIFDEMEVWDFDADGHAVGRIKVPVKLTNKEKVVSQILNNNYQNPNVARDNENVLPMISIGWKGFSPDLERMRGIREKRKIYLEYDNTGTGNRPIEKQHIDMQTIPYKLEFEVILWGKYLDHLVQLVENIDAFIHPEIYLELYEKGLGIGRKVKVVKVSETPQFNPELSETEVRSKFLTWTYTFEMECNLYKPEQPVGKPIKRIINRFSAVTQTQRTQGIDLAEQTVTQTVDSPIAQTPGSSGYCFYDLDSEIVNYTRRFSDEEYSQIRNQYEPLINCQISRQDIMAPYIAPVPPIDYGEILLDGTSDVITIESALLNNAPQYIPQAVILNKNGATPTVFITNYENIQDGSFQVRLSGIPPANGYYLAWYVYQKYGAYGNVTLDSEYTTNTVTISSDLLGNISNFIPQAIMTNSTDEASKVFLTSFGNFTNNSFDVVISAATSSAENLITWFAYDQTVNNPFGEVILDGTTDTISITSNSISGPLEYIPQAILANRNGDPEPIIVTGFKDVIPGSFKVVLSSVPTSGTSIIWYAYKKI